jgi:CheY-like chemotaxis protein
VPEPSRILIVDDDDDSRSFMKELLEGDGYVVSEAGDGSVALDLLTSAPAPALVILDLEMPVMSGRELIEAMKADATLVNLPVLVVSGSGRTVVPLGGPVVSVLTKPVAMGEFVGIVKTWVPPKASG